MLDAKLLKIDRLRLDQIDVGARLRPVSEAGVQALIASIAELGVIKDAIHVRKPARAGGQYALIAGAHRLEAARQLGWADIEVKAWDCSADWAALTEIDDNAAGAEMSPLDTAVFLARRKVLYEKLHPEAASNSFKGNQYKEKVVTDMMSVTTFAAATAEKFGISDRHVRRLVQVGSALEEEDVVALRSASSFVTLADLQTLAKASSDQRRAICAVLEQGEAPGVAAAVKLVRQRQANPVETPAVADVAFRDFCARWARLPRAGKRLFVREHLAEIDALLALEGGGDA